MYKNAANSVFLDPSRAYPSWGLAEPCTVLSAQRSQKDIRCAILVPTNLVNSRLCGIWVNQAWSSLRSGDIHVRTWLRRGGAIGRAWLAPGIEWRPRPTRGRTGTLRSRRRARQRGSRPDRSGIFRLSDFQVFGDFESRSKLISQLTPLLRNKQGWGVS